MYIFVFLFLFRETKVYGARTYLSSALIDWKRWQRPFR